MALPAFDVADGVRATAAFQDLNGNPADPTTITLKVLDPAGTITEPPVFRTGTGSYYADFVLPNEPGSWSYRWEGTGDVQVAEEGKFTVRASAFPL